MPIDVGQSAPGFTLPGANRTTEGRARCCWHCARPYFRFHHAGIPLAADPDLTLIDRGVVVRWANIERTPGEFPSDAQLLDAIR